MRPPLRSRGVRTFCYDGNLLMGCGKMEEYTGVALEYG